MNPYTEERTGDLFCTSCTLTGSSDVISKTNYRNENVLNWKSQSSHYFKPDSAAEFQ